MAFGDAGTATFRDLVALADDDELTALIADPAVRRHVLDAVPAGRTTADLKVAETFPAREFTPGFVVDTLAHLRLTDPLNQENVDQIGLRLLRVSLDHRIDTLAKLPPKQQARAVRWFGHIRVRLHDRIRKLIRKGAEPGRTRAPAPRPDPA